MLTSSAPSASWRTRWEFGQKCDAKKDIRNSDEGEDLLQAPASGTMSPDLASDLASRGITTFVQLIVAGWNRVGLPV